MPEIRTENEVKLYSSGGPFAYSGDDPSEKMILLEEVLRGEGFECLPHTVSKHVDYYYTDVNGGFDSRKIILRYRDMGDRAFLTVKLPSVVNGMGLSRREIEGEVINDSRFDRWKSVQEYAREFCGPAEIRRTPSLIVDVTRGRCIARSEVRQYNFTFDRMVYTDPDSGRRSVPCYEIEIESLDSAIGEDRQLRRVISIMTGRYLFEEERISKYERGRAFLRSLKG